MKKNAAVKKKGVASKSNKLNKQLMLVSVKYIAERIIIEKEKNGGRVPWGFAAGLLKEGKETFPNMSMRTINNYVNKMETTISSGIKLCGSILLDKSSATNKTSVSSLTEPCVPPSPSTQNIASDSEDASDSETSFSSNSSDSSSDNQPSELLEPVRLGGRPKGSTASYSLELRKKVEAATRESVSLLSDLQKEMKRQGRRLKKGAIAETISQCETKHNLPPSIHIKPGTVKQCLKRHSTKGIQGQSSLTAPKKCTSWSS